MSIIYNQHSKEREKVVPPTVEEIERAVKLLNHVDEYGNMSKEVRGIFQRILWRYENLEHFYANAGGWVGLNRLRSASVAASVIGSIVQLADRSTDTTIRECEGMQFNPNDETE